MSQHYVVPREQGCQTFRGKERTEPQLHPEGEADTIGALAGSPRTSPKAQSCPTIYKAGSLLPKSCCPFTECAPVELLSCMLPMRLSIRTCTCRSDHVVNPNIGNLYPSPLESIRALPSFRDMLKQCARPHAAGHCALTLQRYSAYSTYAKGLSHLRRNVAAQVKYKCF